MRVAVNGAAAPRRRGAARRAGAGAGRIPRQHRGDVAPAAARARRAVPGRADRPARSRRLAGAPGDYRIADLADDALALLDELGLDRVGWCGLSLGAMVGMYLARRRRSGSASLTLCCTSPTSPTRRPWTAADRRRRGARDGRDRRGGRGALVHARLGGGASGRRRRGGGDGRRHVRRGLRGLLRRARRVGPPRPAPSDHGADAGHRRMPTIAAHPSSRTPGRSPTGSRAPGWRSWRRRTWRTSSNRSRRQR